MVNTADILAIADSHFTKHLLGPDEADVPPESESEDEHVELADSPTENETAFLPENLVEDFLDDAADMLDEVSELYSQRTGWEKVLIFGFVDGVLAAADDSWSSLEDFYFENNGDAAYDSLDTAISEIDEDFDGSRPWDEAAKGYIRKEVQRCEADPAEDEHGLWTMCAHGFIYGVESGYDQEWKVVVTPAGNILLTDEDSITEAAIAQIESEPGSKSLLGRVFDMMGIDLDELEAAIIEKVGPEDEGSEANA